MDKVVSVGSGRCPHVGLKLPTCHHDAQVLGGYTQDELGGDMDLNMGTTINKIACATNGWKLNSGSHTLFKCAYRRYSPYRKKPKKLQINTLRINLVWPRVLQRAHTGKGLDNIPVCNLPQRSTRQHIALAPAVPVEDSELHDTRVEDDPQSGPSSSREGIVNYEFVLGVGIGKDRGFPVLRRCHTCTKSPQVRYLILIN
ncbi:hypothetical protein E2C01_058925 [Portunus trituberculatus]|uniref:Uncharacterized protein n=1 Tax=Portunus trituberculatus TaxID=210409 RepID=A0A5B7H5H3_PORTR|nr:hypothetical protein [Portunus trituberculatus]